MNVIVTGTLGYDHIMDFPGTFADRIMPDKIHQISLSFLVDKLSKQFGGTAGNIAYTLKLLELNPIILSSYGDDYAPYQAHLLRHGLSLSAVKVSKDIATGAYFVITDQDDNQIGAFYIGAAKNNKKLSLSRDYFSRHETKRSDRIGESSRVGSNSNLGNFVVIAPNEPAAMIKYVQECQNLGFPYLYDPAFQIENFSAEELHLGITGAELLVGNDYEIALIEKKLGVSNKELLKLVPIVVITLGSKGSLIAYNPSSPPLKLRGGRVGLFKINPANPKNTSDPTGAGDAYRAGFLAGYLRGFDLKTCGQMGSVAAVYTVEKYGTQTHYFTKKDFCHRYRLNFHETLSL